MSRAAGVLARLRSLLARRRADARMDEEFDFHLAMEAEKLARAGLPRDEARRRALVAFGGVERWREEMRAGRGAHALEEVAGDVRYALRSLRRQPGFAAATLLTLAVGVGANVAIFSVIDAALLRPLPYHEADRLVHLWETKDARPDDVSEASWPDFVDWRAQSRAFTALEGYDETNVFVAGPDGATMTRGARVTAGFFRLLGTPPRLGRDFAEGEDAPGGARVVIVSDEYWRGALGADARVLGRTLRIDGEPHEVIGVLPRGFRFAPAGDAALWLPLGAPVALREQRINHWLDVVGRLAPGVDVRRAETEMTTLMGRLAVQYPETNAGRGARVVALREQVTGDMRAPMLALLAAVGMLLLIACANVAGLLLARGLTREREFAVRAALGAGRPRLVRQLLAESAVIALGGGVLGAWVATLGVDALVGALPGGVLDRMPYLRDAQVDARVLGYAFVVTLLTGLAFGLAPALAATRASATAALRHGARAVAGRTRARDLLVTAEVALTVALLAGAGMLARSLVGLLRVDPGFEVEQVAVARVAPQGVRYDSVQALRQFFTAALERTAAIPGVRVSGAVNNLPLSGGGTVTFRLEGAPEAPRGSRPEALSRVVGGDYFRAMGIRLVAGRVHDARDREGATPAIVVSETLARRLVPGGAAAAPGSRIRFYAFPDSAWTIVGVVADVRAVSLDVDAPATVYFHYLQATDNRMTLVLRAAGDPAAALAALRREVAAIDPAVPLYGAAPLRQQVADSPAVFARRYPLVLVGAFAVAALVLAVIGVYGVIAHAAARRMREFGVRVALGARRGDVLRLVLRHGAAIGGGGAIAGVALAWLLGRALAPMLYGVSSFDPPALVLAAAVVVCTALAASLLPAWRATRVSPVVALRGE